MRKKMVGLSKNKAQRKERFKPLPLMTHLCHGCREPLKDGAMLVFHTWLYCYPCADKLKWIINDT